MSSSFRSGSVKDDLFIREDVMRKYNIKSPSLSNISNNNNNNNNNNNKNKKNSSIFS